MVNVDKFWQVACVNNILNWFVRHQAVSKVKLCIPVEKLNYAKKWDSNEKNSSMQKNEIQMSLQLYASRVSVWGAIFMVIIKTSEQSSF